MDAAGYESWFLSARDPAGGRALWIRRTVHRSTTGVPTVAHWCTVFGPDGDPVKELFAPDAEPPGARAGPHRFEGRAGERHWSLAVTPAEAACRPLRPGWLYRSPLPRTKVTVPVPDGTVDGFLQLAGTRWDVTGWPATVGHNWGSTHADRWIWLHATGLHGPVRWLDLVVARLRVGGIRSPWLGSGVARIGHRVVPLGGLGHRTDVDVRSATDVRIDLAVPGGRLVTAASSPHRAAAVLYRDPHGGVRSVAHSGLADLTVALRIGRATAATTSGTAALETGATEGGLAAVDLPLED